MADSVMKKPTVHTDEATGLQYLLGSKQVLFETGVVLPRTTFDKYVDGSDKTMLNELLESAASEPQNCNFDFAYAKTTGTLRRKKGNADLVVSMKAERKRKKELEELAIIKQAESIKIKELEAIISAQKLELEAKAHNKILESVIPHNAIDIVNEMLETDNLELTQESTDKSITMVNIDEQKKTVTLTGVLSSVLLVTSIMTIVGIGSAIMSAYHTTLFLFQGGKPFWIAALTGVLFILFSATAFTAARHFFMDKAKWIGVIFALAGITVVLYSVFSTLTVNFNQFKWIDDERTLVAVEDNEALLAHERLLSDNREALEEINARIILLEGEADYWKTMSWRRYDEFQVTLNDAQERRIVLRQRQIELESARPEIVALAENSQETIFSLIERLLRIREDVARFFVYAAPACLYDILAPFALSVVLLLADRRRRKSV